MGELGDGGAARLQSRLSVDVGYYFQQPGAAAPRPDETGTVILAPELAGLQEKSVAVEVPAEVHGRVGEAAESAADGGQVLQELLQGHRLQEQVRGKQAQNCW